MDRVRWVSKSRRCIQITLIVLLTLNATLLAIFLIEYCLIAVTENLKTFDDLIQSVKLRDYIIASGSITIFVDFFVALGVSLCSILSIVRLRRHFGSRFANEMR